MNRHHQDHRDDDPRRAERREEFSRDREDLRELRTQSREAPWDDRVQRDRRDDARHAFREAQLQQEALDSRSRERDSGYREDNTFGISNFDREQRYRGSEWVAPAGGYRPHSERAQFSGPRRGTGYGNSSGYADAERYGSSRRVLDEPLPRGFEEHFAPPRDDFDHRRTERGLQANSAHGMANAARDFDMRDSHSRSLQDRGYRGVGPKNYQRSDDRIREDLCDHLCDAWDVDASEIDIKVRNGIATLTGSVRERSMKHRAEDLAERIPGVLDVENQLKVGNKRAETSQQAPSALDAPATGKTASSRGEAGNASPGTRTN